MITEIHFIVPAVPVAQPRQRSRIASGKGGKQFVQNYTPAKHPVNDFKAAVMHAARAAYSGPPLDVPLSMHVVFVMPRDNAKVWKTKPMPREPYTKKKGDWDNLGKSLSDALNQLVYTDDGLLCDVRVLRVMASGYEQPHVEVRISTEVE